MNSAADAIFVMHPPVLMATTPTLTVTGGDWQISASASVQNCNGTFYLAEWHGHQYSFLTQGVATHTAGEACDVHSDGGSRTFTIDARMV